MNANIAIHHLEITAGEVHETRIFRDPDAIMRMIIRGGINAMIGLRNDMVRIVNQLLGKITDFGF